MLRSSALALVASFALAACGSSSNTPASDGNGSPDAGHGGGSDDGGSNSGNTGNTGNTGNSGSDAGAPAAGEAGAGSTADAGPAAPTPLTAVGTLVVLGDSISMGGGQAPFYYNLLLSNDDTTYPEWKGMDLQTKYGASVMMVNHAVAGSTSSDLPTQVSGLPTSLPGPVAVVLTIGGNDMQDNIAAILQGVDQGLRQQFDSNIASALSQLTMPGRFGTGVDVHVYEADIYDPSDGSGNFMTCPAPLSLIAPQPSDQFFAEWNLVVDTEVPKHPQSFVGPLHTAFHTHGINAGAANWFYTDCIHPNSKGHDAIRGMFWTMITGEVGPQPPM